MRGIWFDKVVITLQCVVVEHPIMTSVTFSNQHIFASLIDTQAPLPIVRVLLFWYLMQNVCIKWENSYLHYFTICNGVSPGWYSKYDSQDIKLKISTK